MQNGHITNFYNKDQLYKLIQNNIKLYTSSFAMPTQLVFASWIDDTSLKQPETATIKDLTPTDSVSQHAQDSMLIYPQGWSAAFGNAAQYKLIELVDDDNNDMLVGKSQVIRGKAGDSFAVNYSLPANYELAPNQNIPKNVTLIQGANIPLEIHLKHLLKHVDAGNSNFHIGANKNIHLVNSKQTPPDTQNVIFAFAGMQDIITDKMKQINLSDYTAKSDPDSFKNDIHVPGLDGYSMISNKLGYLQL